MSRSSNVTRLWHGAPLLLQSRRGLSLMAISVETSPASSTALAALTVKCENGEINDWSVVVSIAIRI